MEQIVESHAFEIASGLLFAVLGAVVGICIEHIGFPRDPGDVTLGNRLTLNYVINNTIVNPTAATSSNPPSSSRTDGVKANDDAWAYIGAAAVVIVVLASVYLTYRDIILNTVFFAACFAFGLTLFSLLYLLGREFVAGLQWALFLVFGLLVSTFGLVVYEALKHPDFRQGGYGDLLAEFDVGKIDAVIQRYGIINGAGFVAYQAIGVLAFIVMIFTLVIDEIWLVSATNVLLHARPRWMWSSILWASSHLLPSRSRRSPAFLAIALSGLGALALVFSNGFVFNELIKDGGRCLDREPRFEIHLAALKSHLGDAMGDPTECERTEATTGDVQQHTTTGLAYWRRTTGIPTFTKDGVDHLALRNGIVVEWDGGTDPPN